MILKRLYFKLFSLGDPNWGKGKSGKNGANDDDSRPSFNGSNDDKSSEK